MSIPRPAPSDGSILFIMTVQETPLSSIDLTNETYRISEKLDSPRLQSSLQEIGQLSPVLLLEAASRRTILCGFRRTRALRVAGASLALARIIPEGTRSPVDLFRVAIFDNLSHREFSPLEKARILHTLKDACQVPQGELVSDYLPLLGLQAHKNVLHTYLGIHVLDPDLRRLFDDGRLTLASVERFSDFSREAQRGFAALLDKVRLSASRQREMLDLTAELAAIADSCPEEILSRVEIQSIVDEARFSPFQKGEKICETLYRWRNPRLSGAERKFEQDRLRLGLPVGVRISPEPHFETPRLRVEFDVDSARRFREIAAALRDASETPALEELFRVC